MQALIRAAWRRFTAVRQGRLSELNATRSGEPQSPIAGRSSLLEERAACAGVQAMLRPGSDRTQTALERFLFALVNRQRRFEDTRRDLVHRLVIEVRVAVGD